MDYQFPSQLFPGFYTRGPPDSVFQHCGGSWGSYDRVLPQGGSGGLSSWTFTSRHQAKGEAWSPTEPAPVPLLSPKHALSWPSTPPDPVDFVEHMQNFYTDHHQEAFGCMAELLGHDFNFQKNKGHFYSVNVQRMRRLLDMERLRKCELAYSSRVADAYSTILADVMHTVPPELLGSLLREELVEQRERLLGSQDATGGALAFVPFSGSGSSSGGSRRGCLLYPGQGGLDSLNFHMVTLQHQRGGPSGVDAERRDRFSFQLKGPIRQISTASLFTHCCVAVRSHHLCGAWSFSERDKPRLLQVIDTTEVATCVSASPHILGEVLVASEGGAAALWTVGRGIQKVRLDDQNLYFNAESSWRWCEFSAHPRVMVYADQTGAELTDMRENAATAHTLFQISNTSDCRRGERLSLSRYLGQVHPFHHLVTTQFSAYIVDERFAVVPMVKVDHQLQTTPVFCHVVSGSDSSSSTKILLGSRRSQEITMLQYSGGRAAASVSVGPPRSLLRPSDGVEQLPVQLPHRLVTVEDRLSLPAGGLTCIHQTGSRAEECVCVLQLTEAGDIFYQILQPEVDAASGRDVGGDGGPTSNSRRDTGGDGGPPSSSRRDAGGDGGPPSSSSSLSRWRRWYLKLMRRRERSVPGPETLQQVLVPSTSLLRHCSAEDTPRSSDQDSVDWLRQELSTCMSQRSLLLSSSVPASLGPLDLVPLPRRVDTDAWTDQLSRRLTASWRGEDAWRSWWTEELGLDREHQLERLRRRRRREKEARRAGGAGGAALDWPDSFSSSASCLSDWNQSSRGGSDSESTRSHRSQDGPRAQPARDQDSSQKSPSTSFCPLVAHTSTASRKRSRDELDSCRSPPPLPQGEEPGSEGGGASPPLSAVAASVQRRSSQRLSPVSRVDQDTPGLSNPSQSQSSQSSQSGVGRAPSWQRQRRSQMGF